MTTVNISPSSEQQILFVGVDPMEVDLILHFLETNRKVQFAYNLDQAQKLLSHSPPELVICEAERRGLDVRKLLDHPEAPSMVFLSSRDKDLEQRKSILRVKECYLTRPYSEEQLLKATVIAQEKSRLH